MVQPLTKRQKEILDYIQTSITKNGYAPSLLEIKNFFRLKAVSTVHEHLENLKSKGYIKKEMNQARGIQIQKYEISNNFVRVNIKGYIQKERAILKTTEKKSIIVDRKLIDKQEQFFGLIVQDNSLKELNILKDDILIVQETEKAKKNDIIVENKKNKLVMTIYNGISKIKIQGKAISLLRQYRISF